MQRLRGLAVIALLTACTGLMAEDGDPVRITNGEWPPYLGENEPDYGIASKIVSRAFEHAGYEIEYGFFPWSRSLYMAREGDWDGTAVWLPSAEREEDFHISDPVLVTRYVFFHRRDHDFEWDMVADLAGYRIGVTQDYDYGEVIELADKLGIADTEPAASDTLNFEKLIAGRIDLFPMDRLVGEHMLRDSFSEADRKTLDWHPKAVRQDRLRLLLSREVPENEQRIEDFNKALKDMRQEGEVERMLVKALTEQWTNPD